MKYPISVYASFFLYPFVLFLFSFILTSISPILYTLVYNLLLVCLLSYSCVIRNDDSNRRSKRSVTHFSRKRDSSHCTEKGTLNRQTGQIQQYSFTFGNQYHIFDNRLQAFIREGVVITARLNTVDTSSFTWQASLDASITTEELY